MSANTNMFTFYQIDRLFVTGVIKVQIGRVSLLNHDEKRSLCRAGVLLPEDTPDDKEELAVPTERISFSHKEASRGKGRRGAGVPSPGTTCLLRRLSLPRLRR